MTSIAERLAQMYIDLPIPPAPAANYVPYTIAGNILTISGQLPMEDGEIKAIGKLGQSISVEKAYEAAKICAINILAQANAALDGDLERIAQCMRLGGFVNATGDFTDHPKVVNGASDLIAEVLDDRGKHARFAVGAGSLPFGVAVEVDAQFMIKSDT